MWSVAAATAVCALERVSLLDPGSDLHQKLGGFTFTAPSAYIFGSNSEKILENSQIFPRQNDSGENLVLNSLPRISSYEQFESSNFSSNTNTHLSSSMYFTSPHFVEVQTISNPDYIDVFEWEKFEVNRWRRWMGQHWAWSIYASIIYLTIIFGIQKFMKNRQPFQIRGLLTTWNIVLAAFSIMGFLRTAPELFHTLSQPDGFYQTICVRENHTVTTAMWGFLMTLSKLVELGDTFFIVLRKQPLIFLHWYHHITVLIYTWFTYEAYDPALRWFMSINMFIHSLMYSYYALKSLKIFVPRNFAMVITTLQLSQMFVGVSINVYSLWVKAFQGNHCSCLYENITAAFLMYASYSVLFGNFFYHSYLKKRKMM